MEENALLKIADFGLSKALYGEEQTSTVCGTPGYCGKVKQLAVIFLSFLNRENHVSFNQFHEVLGV